MADEISKKKGYTVGGLASLVKVTRETVRYYTRIGLLDQNKDPMNGYHIYFHEDIKRIQFIVQIKRLGLSLSEVEIIINELRKGKVPNELLCTLLDEKIIENKVKITNLFRLQREIDRVHCLLIEATKEKPKGISPMEWEILLAEEIEGE